MNQTHTQASDNLTRRDALKTLGISAALLGLGLLSTRKLTAATDPKAKSPISNYPFTLPPLGYSYDALEPHIDARTMEIHYTKHHQAYVTNANKALETQPELQKLTLESILLQLDKIPEPARSTLRNNLGGHANHTFFWQIIAPTMNAGSAASPVAAVASPAPLHAAIADTFDSLEKFQKQFTDAALGRFGSGWAWLVVSNTTGKLTIATSANQDTPLLTSDIPVLGIDVWEHAYYLKYQNRRADYIAAYWNVVNWPRAAAYYATATTRGKA